MPALDSEAMRFAQYRSASRELDITFASGLTYTYYGVPKREYDGMMEAESAGSYFNRRIRNRYKFRKGPRVH